MRYRQHGFGHLVLMLIVVVLAVVGFAGWRVYKEKSSSSGFGTSGILKADDPALEKAIKAGKYLSSGQCEGTSKVKLTHLPMREQDFSILIPYGLVVGGHVTPIDHQYFGPKDQKSPRDAYPVYAMADSRITDIQPRTNERGTEYRFVFTVSCTSLYYYDLVTSLSGKAKEAWDAKQKSRTYQMNMPVKAGDLIGAIGGQTLDFAVWDTEKPLTGFINPASYDGEAWKIYTADPYPYYTPELKTLLIERNPRTVEPIAGKIDFDIDGKLIGNWFTEGSGGYHGLDNKSFEYWGGHLSIAPNHYDPSVFIISLGNFNGEASQFVDADYSPDPATVGVDTGLVKYDLKQYSNVKADGSPWDGNSLTKSPKVVASGPSRGCMLAQLITTRKLKAEAFPGKACASVSNFSASAKTYER